MLSDRWYRVRTALRRQAVEDDLEEEVCVHLDRETAKHVARGVAPAEARRRADESPSVRDDEFARFMDSLVEEGLPVEMAEDQDVRDYLLWRGRIAVAQRMNDVGAEADVLAERDKVLTEAIRLLTSTTTQAELFQAVDDISPTDQVGARN